MGKNLYDKNITDIKDTYMEMLIEILNPLLFEGMKSIYDNAKEVYEENENDTVEFEDVFKLCLKDVSNLSSKTIKEELERIKEVTKSSGYFDNLVKAVVKSYIILLTYNTSGKKCKLIEEKAHEQINIGEFIHTCYIEFSQVVFNNPSFFIDFVENIDKDTDLTTVTKTMYMMPTKEEMKAIISKIIKISIYKQLPLEKIIDEYIKNDTIRDDEEEMRKKIEEEEYMENLTTRISEKINDKIEGKMTEILEKVLSRQETIREESKKEETVKEEPKEFEVHLTKPDMNLIHTMNSINYNKEQTAPIPSINMKPETPKDIKEEPKEDNEFIDKEILEEIFNHDEVNNANEKTIEPKSDKKIEESIEIKKEPTQTDKPIEKQTENKETEKVEVKQEVKEENIKVPEPTNNYINNLKF